VVLSEASPFEIISEFGGFQTYGNPCMGRGTSNESGLKQAIQAGQSRRNRVTENISPKQAGEGQSQIEP